MLPEGRPLSNLQLRHCSTAQSLITLAQLRPLSCWPAARACVEAHAAASAARRSSDRRGPPAAVRVVPLRIISVAKGNSPGAALMAEEWVEKVRRYAPLTDVRVRPNPKNAASADVAVQAEGQQILRLLSAQECVVVLDERGRDTTSHDMANLIAQAGETASGLTFVIGGPHGNSDTVRQRADSVLRLSSMVLNHQVAHVVLLEQIYRGWTILRGEPYHH